MLDATCLLNRAESVHAVPALHTLEVVGAAMQINIIHLRNPEAEVELSRLS
jgi:hypothetical protein